MYIKAQAHIYDLFDHSSSQTQWNVYTWQIYVTIEWRLSFCITGSIIHPLFTSWNKRYKLTTLKSTFFFFSSSGCSDVMWSQSNATEFVK